MHDFFTHETNLLDPEKSRSQSHSSLSWQYPQTRYNSINKHGQTTSNLPQDEEEEYAGETFFNSSRTTIRGVVMNIIPMEAFFLEQ